MAIKFHCSCCGKKIEAPDTAGGKWGKCPACHAKLYVPLPQVEVEDELKLAPIDETDEQRKKQLWQETFQLTQDILQEKVAPESPATGPATEIGEEQLTNHIIHYLRQMFGGDLDAAQKTADLIVPHRRKAVAILDHIIKSKTPHRELEDIPQQVLSGLVRNLRTRMTY